MPAAPLTSERARRRAAALLLSLLTGVFLVLLFPFYVGAFVRRLAFSLVSCVCFFSLALVLLRLLSIAIHDGPQCLVDYVLSQRA